MTTISSGENFLLEFTLLDDDSVPIPADQFAEFVVRAEQSGRIKYTWTWLPDDAGNPTVELTDGLCTVEVDSSITLNWLGDIEFKAIPSFIDTQYFVAGSQTDVVCFDDLLTVVECQS